MSALGLNPELGTWTYSKEEIIKREIRGIAMLEQLHFSWVIHSQHQ